MHAWITTLCWHRSGSRPRGLRVLEFTCLSARRPVHLAAGAEHHDLQALSTYAAQGPFILRERWVCTTTYATTYGWVSAGIRRELIAPPRSKMRTDGTKRDQTGLNRYAERLATNQKAAGSSPAERAT